MKKSLKLSCTQNGLRLMLFQRVLIDKQRPQKLFQLYCISYKHLTH